MPVKERYGRIIQEDVTETLLQRNPGSSQKTSASLTIQERNLELRCAFLSWTGQYFQKFV